MILLKHFLFPITPIRFLILFCSGTLLSKMGLVLFLSISHLTAQARSKYPVFRDPHPSAVIQPNTSKLSLFFNLENQWIAQTSGSKNTTPPRWVDLNLFSSYEVSPFYDLTDLNIGIQGSIGSYGAILYVMSKWIPFPDYQWQPAIGLFADLFGGFQPDKNFTTGSHIQLLVKKTFSHSYANQWSPYIAPILQMQFIPTFQHHWIGTAGLKFYFAKTKWISSDWLINVEGQYGTSYYGISLQWILFIQ